MNESLGRRKGEGWERRERYVCGTHVRTSSASSYHSVSSITHPSLCSTHPLLLPHQNTRTKLNETGLCTDPVPTVQLLNNKLLKKLLSSAPKSCTLTIINERGTMKQLALKEWSEVRGQDQQGIFVLHGTEQNSNKLKIKGENAKRSRLTLDKPNETN